jgi:hypothetical protein
LSRSLISAALFMQVTTQEGRSSVDGRNYDPSNKFQVIGNGELTDQQKKKFAEEERQQL